MNRSTKRQGLGREADDELEGAIESALAEPPAVAVPAGFARRVALQAAADESRLLRGIRRGDAGAGMQVGVRTAWAVAALLLLAMLALALRPAETFTNTGLWLELALELSFAALALGLSLRRLLAWD